jgi:hypothetical protein
MLSGRWLLVDLKVWPRLFLCFQSPRLWQIRRGFRNPEIPWILDLGCPPPPLSVLHVRPSSTHRLRVPPRAEALQKMSINRQSR